MDNKIDLVLQAVFNHDKHRLGLLSEPIDTSTISHAEFVLYLPCFDTRLDMVSYELSYIIYSVHNQPADLEQFKQWIKYDPRGKQLFQTARELAQRRLQPELTHRQIRRKLLTPSTSKRIIKLTLIATTLCTVYTLFSYYFG